MAQKLYDVVVKTGEYQSQGETKSRYENIGVVLQGDKGPYMLLKRTFNPAGVASDRDTIMVSLFEPKDDQQQASSQQPPQKQAPQGQGFQGNPGGSFSKQPF